MRGMGLSWKRALVLSVLVAANLMVGRLLMKDSRLFAQPEGGACCANCICWCHNSGPCNSLGTGNPCSAGSFCPT